MSYGHGPRLAGSGWVMGARVVYRTASGRRVPGVVMGPDPDYVPCPAEVFVSFPGSGVTQLVAVGELERIEGAADGP